MSSNVTDHVPVDYSGAPGKGFLCHACRGLRKVGSRLNVTDGHTTNFDIHLCKTCCQAMASVPGTDGESTAFN